MVYCYTVGPDGGGRIVDNKHRFGEVLSRPIRDRHQSGRSEIVVVVAVSSSQQSPSIGVSRFRQALSIAIPLSVWSASKGSQKMVGVMWRMTAVVAIVARCRVYSIHVLTKDMAVTGAQLCQCSSCLPW